MSHHIHGLRGSVLAFVTMLFGCQTLSPVEVKGCSVRALGHDRVEFSALLRNSDDKPISHVFVLASARKSNLFEYRVDGPILRGRWIKVVAIKDASIDFNSSYASHLGPVDYCYVHLVYYDDGSTWNGGTPM